MRAGGTGWREAVTVVRRDLRGRARRAGGEGGARRDRAGGREAWMGAAGRGDSDLCGESSGRRSCGRRRYQKGLSRSSAALRDDTVYVSDSRACSVRRLSRAAGAGAVGRALGGRGGWRRAAGGARHGGAEGRASCATY